MCMWYWLVFAWCWSICFSTLWNSKPMTKRNFSIHILSRCHTFPCLQNTAEIIHFRCLSALLKSNSWQKGKYNNDSLQKRIRLNVVVLYIQVIQKSVRTTASVIPQQKSAQINLVDYVWLWQFKGITAKIRLHPKKSWKETAVEIIWN